MIFTTYIRGISVETGKTCLPLRRAGGVDIKSHSTPFSFKAPTENMFAPRSRTSSTSNDTGTIWFRSLRMPNCSVPFVLALDIPHDPFMRILQSDLLTTY